MPWGPWVPPTPAQRGGAPPALAPSPSRARGPPRPRPFRRRERPAWLTRVRRVPLRHDAAVDVADEPNTATPTQRGVSDRRAQGYLVSASGSSKMWHRSRASGMKPQRGVFTSDVVAVIQSRCLPKCTSCSVRQPAKAHRPLVCSIKRPKGPDSMRVAGAVDRAPFDPEIVGKLGSPRPYPLRYEPEQSLGPAGPHSKAGTTRNP